MSTTVVGAIGQAPASTTAWTCFSKRSRMSCGSFIGLVSPGGISVVASSGWPKQREQVLRHAMVRHAQADRAARRVRHPARHLLGRLEDERERPGRAVLEQAVLAVVDARVARQLATGRGTAASGDAGRRRRGCGAASRPRPCRRGGRRARSSSRWGSRRRRRRAGSAPPASAGAAAGCRGGPRSTGTWRIDGIGAVARGSAAPSRRALRHSPSRCGRRRAHARAGCARRALPTRASVARAAGAACRDRCGSPRASGSRCRARRAARTRARDRCTSVVGGAVAAGHDLDAAPAVRLELGEQRVLLGWRELVARRMRDHRHAAGMRDPAHRIAERGPAMRHEAGLALDQVPAKHLRACRRTRRSRPGSARSACARSAPGCRRTSARLRRRP